MPIRKKSGNLSYAPRTFNNFKLNHKNKDQSKVLVVIIIPFEVNIMLHFQFIIDSLNFYCVYLGSISSLIHIWLNKRDILCLHIFVRFGLWHINHWRLFNAKSIFIHINSSSSNNSVWHTDRIISADTIPSQSGPGSDGNKGVPRISKSSSITGASPSDCLVSYSGYSLRGVLALCSDAASVLCSPSRLGHTFFYIYPLATDSI